MRTVKETANLIDRRPAPLAPGRVGMCACGVAVRSWLAGEVGACGA